MTKTNNGKNPRFPQSVTDRLDAQGDRLGLIGAPAALFKVDLGLNSDERLFCFGLFEHYRQNAPSPTHPTSASA